MHKGSQSLWSAGTQGERSLANLDRAWHLCRTRNTDKNEKKKKNQEHTAQILRLLRETTGEPQVARVVRSLLPMQETQRHGLSLWARRSPGGWHTTHTCLENPTDRGAWQATVHGVAKSRTRLKSMSMRAERQWATFRNNKRFLLLEQWSSQSSLGSFGVPETQLGGL